MRLLEPLSILASLGLHAAAIAFLIILWSRPGQIPEGAPISATIESIPIQAISPAGPDQQITALPHDEPPSQVRTQPPDIKSALAPDEIAPQPPTYIVPANPELAAHADQPDNLKSALPDRQLNGESEVAEVNAPERVPLAKSEAAPNVQASKEFPANTPSSPEPPSRPAPPPVRSVVPAVKQARQPTSDRSAAVRSDHFEHPGRASIAGVAPQDDGAASAGYAAGLAGRLRSHTSFPSGAPSGTVVVHFSVDRSGRLLARTLVRSSGSSLLDAAALASVDRAAPFPPFPPGMTRSRLEVTVPLAFRAQ